MNTILSTLPAAWRRLARRMQEARQQRRSLRELSRMSAYDLRDLGLSHAASAAAPAPSRFA